MVVITLLWSTAGVVTRQLESAHSFEVTFWRSGFNALCLSVVLRILRGPALWGQVLRASRRVWASGLCWCVMFTAFMVALTLTTVAQVLVTMALGPLMTALFSRLFLHHRLPARTWSAIVVGSAGIAWMFGQQMQGGVQGLQGMVVALCVPMAAATNYTLLQHHSRPAAGQVQRDAPDDMLLAVLLGALLSALICLPLAWPLSATNRDLVLLAGMGCFQLALPCLLVVRLSRVLAAPEIALLGLLEVVFGVLWAWLGAGEVPASATLTGGAMVLGALAGNEWLGWRAGAASPAS